MTHARRFPRDYVADGLRVRSFVPLRFAVPCMGAPAAAPDVTVRFGAVPAALRVPASERLLGDWMEWEAAPGHFLLHMRGIARYLATEGRDVLVEPCGGDDREVDEHLVDKVWAAVLLQRGIFPFHASAVAFEAGAALFLGSSGAGKSSLVGALLKRGHAMLADDFIGVTPGASCERRTPSGFPAPSADFRILALPAYPRLRLCADMLDALGWRGEAIGQAGRSGKHPVPVRRFHAAPLPVCALFLLGSHNRSGIEISTLRGVEAVKELRRCAWRNRLTKGLGRRRKQFRVVAALARQAPVVRVTRPAHLLRFDDLADRIETHVRETVRGKEHFAVA